MASYQSQCPVCTCMSKKNTCTAVCQKRVDLENSPDENPPIRVYLMLLLSAELYWLAKDQVSYDEFISTYLFYQWNVLPFAYRTPSRIMQVPRMNTSVCFASK